MKQSYADSARWCCGLLAAAPVFALAVGCGGAPPSDHDSTATNQQALWTPFSDNAGGSSNSSDPSLGGPILNTPPPSSNGDCAQCTKNDGVQYYCRDGCVCQSVCDKFYTTGTLWGKIQWPFRTVLICFEGEELLTCS
jgi:hypothetical protein